MLNEEVIIRNRHKQLDKHKLLKLLVQQKLQVHVTTLCYDARVIVVEDGGLKYTLKHDHPDCTDHYLIPVYSRGDYYIRKWINDTVIFRRRKNLLFFNQVNTLINLLWSLF